VGYRLRLGAAGTAQQYAGEVELDVPGALRIALAGAAPNPARGATTVSFTLASGAPARLTLVDVRGRIVEAHDVGRLGAGPHALALGAGARLRPGLYLVRLAQGAQERIAKVALLP